MGRWNIAGGIGICYLVTVFFKEGVRGGLFYGGLGCVLLFVSLTDIKEYRIPNKAVAAGSVWWCLSFWWQEGAARALFWQGILGGLVFGGGLFVLTLLTDKIFQKGSIGGGDIKLFFLAGLFFGVEKGVVHLLISCITALLWAGVTRKKRIPFGPSIALGAWITILLGGFLGGG